MSCRHPWYFECATCAVLHCTGCEYVPEVLPLSVATVFRVCNDCRAPSDQRKLWSTPSPDPIEDIRQEMNRQLRMIERPPARAPSPIISLIAHAFGTRDPALIARVNAECTITKRRLESVLSRRWQALPEIRRRWVVGAYLEDGLSYSAWCIVREVEQHGRKVRPRS